MFARISTMVAKDLRTATRDNLALYILISPILLGLLALVVLPIFEHARPQFVVTEALSSVDLDALAAHGEVEVVADRDQLEDRVRGRDDATGVVPAGQPAVPGEVEVIVQGDEPELLQGLPRAIVDQASRARRGEPSAARDPVSAGDPSTDIRVGLSALLAFIVPALISLMIGFTILEEKTSKTYLVYDVSPLRFWEYVGAKLGLIASLSLILVVPTLAILLGFAEVDWLAVELMVLAATPFAASYGLLIGVFAKDQLGAIALIKSLSPVWTSLPILGFVLPEAWMWTQVPFANHWAVQGLFHALGDGEGIALHGGLALATGLPVFAATLWTLRRKLGFV